MDYGYRMLRHIVAQVFGNLGQAARLTLVPTFLPAAILLALFMSWGVSYTTFGDPTVDPAQLPDVNPGVIFLTVLAGVVVSVITYCWAAVGWHRFVLLEEYGRGVVPVWHGPYIMSYLGRAFLIGLFAVAVSILAMIVIGIIISVVQSNAIAFVLLTGFTLGLTWLITRVGLILPAAALGQKMSFGESWEATKPVASHMLVPLFFISLAMVILNQLVIAIFGDSALSIVPSAVLYWFQVLLNLSLMTTLYGTQVEGRTLT